MLSGSMSVQIDGVSSILTPGDAFYVPAGVPHSYAAAGSTISDAIFGVAPTY